MRAVVAHRVPGEDLGWSFPIALGVVGAVCCWGALASWTARAGDGPSPVVAPSLVVAPRVVEREVERVVERPAVASAPSASAAPSAVAPVAAGAACAPLVVTFRLGWPGPPPATEAAARALGEVAAASPTATFVVDGHADGTGNEITNFDLSRRRAASVALLLERAGISRARLTIRGLGAYVPLEGEPETAAANRRVVVSIKNAASCPFAHQENVNP